MRAISNANLTGATFARRNCNFFCPQSKPRSSIVILPEAGDEEALPPGRQRGRPDTASPLLLDAMRQAMETRGEEFVPDGKAPLRAVQEQYVREIFYRRYIDAEADKAKSDGAQRKAFQRAVHAALNARTVNGQKDAKGNPFLWFVRDEVV